MSKKIVIDKHQWDFIMQYIKEHMKTIVHIVNITEIDIDQSIEERAKEYFDTELEGFIITMDNEQVKKELIKFATEQDLISKAREKEFAKWCFLNNYYYLRGVWKHIDFNLRESEYYQKIYTTEELFNQFTNR